MDTRTLPPPERLGVAVEPLEITLRVRMPAYSYVVDAVWLMVWAVAETILAVSLVRETLAPRLLLIPFLVLFTAAGVFVALRLAWMTTGREVVRVLRNFLVLRREMAVFGRSHIVALDAIRGVRLGYLRQDPVYPSWGRAFVGKGPCYVELDLADDVLLFGRGLGEAKARAVVESLQTRLRERRRS